MRPTTENRHRLGRHAESGQSILELALVLPLLLGVVIGIFEFGLAWNRQQILTNAAREGARFGVLQGPDEDDITLTIENYLDASGVDSSLASIVVTNGEAGTGADLTVQISYPHEFRFLGPVMGLMSPSGGDGPGDITLQTFVTMRHE